MLRIVTAILLASTVSSAAMAADLVPFEGEQVAVPVESSAYDWSGLYLGVHGGYFWGEIENVTEDPERIEGRIDGAFGGVQAGYRFQFANNFVLGAQISAPLIAEDQEGETSVVESSAEFQWSVLGQLHVGFAIDRWMVFATGGVGTGEVEVTRDIVGGATETQENDHMLYTAGFGVNYGITERVTTGVRWNHLWTSDERYDFTFSTGDFEVDADTVTAVLEFKF